MRCNYLVETHTEIHENPMEAYYKTKFSARIPGKKYLLSLFFFFLFFLRKRSRKLECLKNLPWTENLQVVKAGYKSI